MSATAATRPVQGSQEDWAQRDDWILFWTIVFDWLNFGILWWEVGQLDWFTRCTSWGLLGMLIGSLWFVDRESETQTCGNSLGMNPSLKSSVSLS